MALTGVVPVCVIVTMASVLFLFLLLPPRKIEMTMAKTKENVLLFLCGCGYVWIGQVGGKEGGRGGGEKRGKEEDTCTFI